METKKKYPTMSLKLFDKRDEKVTETLKRYRKAYNTQCKLLADRDGLTFTNKSKGKMRRYLVTYRERKGGGGGVCWRGGQRREEKTLLLILDVSPNRDECCSVFNKSSSNKNGWSAVVRLVFSFFLFSFYFFGNKGCCCT